MKTIVPPRVSWAVDLLALKGDERVLEIGGGPGIAARLMCDRLRTGRLLAVDRSPVATGRTVGRNAEHVRTGRLEVRTLALADLNVPDESFDLAFAVDVNLFWTGPATRELGVLLRALRRGGGLHICYGAGGPQRPGEVSSKVCEALRENGFSQVRFRSDPAGFGFSGLREG